MARPPQPDQQFGINQQRQPQYSSLETHCSIMDDNLRNAGDADVPPAASSEVPANGSTQLQPILQEVDQTKRWSYLTSTDFRELLASLIFFLLCLCIYLGEESLVNQQRPIPVQYLDNSNEYVVNIDNNAQVLPETVSNTALLVWTELVPLILQLLLSRVNGFRRVGDTHGTCCVYLVALGLTHFSTEAVKLYVGYLRPIFFAACEPSDDYQTCTNEQSDVNQVRLSFVSGHASTAFCGMLLFSQYIHGRLGLPGALSRDDAPRSLYLGRFISILSLLPIAVAVFIACSRVVDNRHFPADIVGGALLGGSIALFVHKLWL